jgi:azurin
VPGIIAATKLLQPRGKEVLNFTAPKKAGDYPYVCTFPGHWVIMNGKMVVK